MTELRIQDKLDRGESVTRENVVVPPVTPQQPPMMNQPRSWVPVKSSLEIVKTHKRKITLEE